MTTELFSKRLVYIESEADIDSLKPKSVVCVKNYKSVVFDRKEGDIMVFYCTDILDDNVLVELTAPRDDVSNAGNMIYFTFGQSYTKRNLTPADGDYYLERKNDLVELRLMK